MNTSIGFLYLNEHDMIDAGVKDRRRCLAAMEDMFSLLYKGDYRMGGEDANEHGVRVSFPKESNIKGMPLHAPDYRFMAMPAYLGGRFHMFGIKTYGSHHTNKEIGLPRSILMMTLMDVDTGVPIAYMSANVLSAMRSAATVCVGVKYLSIEKPKTLGIIGPGIISTYTLDAILDIKPTIDTVKIKGRGAESLERFIGHIKGTYPTVRTIIDCDSIEDTCRDSDIIFFGTTNAARYEDNPHIEESWVKKGALIISASSLLISTDFLAVNNVRLVAANYKMYEEWGKGNPVPTQQSVSTLLGMGFYDAVCQNKISRDAIVDIGKIIVDQKAVREHHDQVIVYAVGGMSLEDVAWAYDCYQVAKEKKLGTMLTLWDEPDVMR